MKDKKEPVAAILKDLELHKSHSFDITRSSVIWAAIQRIQRENGLWFTTSKMGDKLEVIRVK